MFVLPTPEFVKIGKMKNYWKSQNLDFFQNLKNFKISRISKSQKFQNLKIFEFVKISKNK